MTGHLAGEVYSLLAALAWALALVLFKQSGERVPPLALNLFKNTIGLVFLAATLLVTRDGIGPLRQFPIEDVWLLLLSGVIGVALADTLFFYSLNLVGVGLLSIVDCLYTPSTIFFAWLLIGERLSGPLYFGAGLILLGVLIASRHTPSAQRTPVQLLTGVLLGAVSIILVALGIVLAKLVLQHYPLVWATTLRLLGGTLVLALVIAASPLRKAAWSAFRPGPIWTHSVPASILSSYVCLLLWVAGFKYTHASTAAVLNQSSVIFAVLLAAPVLKEPLTNRKLAAVGLALGGVVLVTFGPR